MDERRIDKLDWHCTATMAVFRKTWEGNPAVATQSLCRSSISGLYASCWYRRKFLQYQTSQILVFCFRMVCTNESMNLPHPNRMCFLHCSCKITTPQAVLTTSTISSFQSFAMLRCDCYHHVEVRCWRTHHSFSNSSCSIWRTRWGETAVKRGHLRFGNRMFDVFV